MRNVKNRILLLCMAMGLVWWIAFGPFVSFALDISDLAKIQEENQALENEQQERLPSRDESLELKSEAEQDYINWVPDPVERLRESSRWFGELPNNVEFCLGGTRCDEQREQGDAAYLTYCQEEIDLTIATCGEYQNITNAENEDDNGGYLHTREASLRIICRQNSICGSGNVLGEDELLEAIEAPPLSEIDISLAPINTPVNQTYQFVRRMLMREDIRVMSFEIENTGALNIEFLQTFRTVTPEDAVSNN